MRIHTGQVDRHTLTVLSPFPTLDLVALNFLLVTEAAPQLTPIPILEACMQGFPSKAVLYLPGQM